MSSTENYVLLNEYYILNVGRPIYKFCPCIFVTAFEKQYLVYLYLIIRQDNKNYTKKVQYLEQENGRERKRERLDHDSKMHFYGL